MRILGLVIFRKFTRLRLSPVLSPNVRISWLQMGPHAVRNLGCSDGSHTICELAALLGKVIDVACGQVLFVYGSKIRAKSIASRNILAADPQSKHENLEGV